MRLEHVQQVNQLTEKIIALREEIEARAKRPAHPRVGTWRHQLAIDRLKLEVEYLERKRLTLFSVGVERAGYVEAASR